MNARIPALLALLVLGGLPEAFAKPPVQTINSTGIDLSQPDAGKCKDPKTPPRCKTSDEEIAAYLTQKNLQRLRIPPEPERASDPLCTDGGALWNYLAKAPINEGTDKNWADPENDMDFIKIDFRRVVDGFRCIDDAVAKMLDDDKGPYVDMKKAYAVVADDKSPKEAKVASVSVILGKTGNPIQEFARLAGAAPTTVNGAVSGGTAYVQWGQIFFDFSNLTMPGGDLAFAELPYSKHPVDELKADTVDMDVSSNKDFNLKHMAALWTDEAACSDKQKAPIFCWYSKDQGKKIRARYDDARNWLNQVNEFVRTASSTTPSVAALAGHCPPAWATKWVHTEEASDTGCPHDGTTDNLGALLALQQAAPPPNPKGNVGAPGAPTDVTALENKIKQNTLTKMGLDQYYDNAAQKWKDGIPADKAAQIQAIQAGKLQATQGSNMSFVFTTPQGKQTIGVPVPGNAATDQAGVDSASDGIKAALLADKPGAAVGQGVVAAVTNNVPPGPAVTGGPAGTTTVGAGANVGAGGGGQIASLLGPGTVVGTAGCGSPGGVPQSTADTGAASAASRSSARQKAGAPAAPAAAPVATPVDAGAQGTGVVPGPVGTAPVGGQ